MSEYIVEMGNSSYQPTSGKQLADVAREMASFDLVNVVRCRDCRFYKCGDDGWWCLRSISTKSNHPDGFCAWGEKVVEQ